jgi:multidrug efflux system membrane fusion protein
VPTAAVQRGPNGTFVYVVREDDTVGVRPVTVSQQDDVQSVIRTGVQGDERVVTTGFARLADGSDVIVTRAEDAGQIATPAPGSERRRDGTRGPRGGRKRDTQASGGTPSKTQ